MNDSFHTASNTSLNNSTRSFPPLYASSGNESVDRLAFFHILEKLKTQKRTGWVYNNISNPESISDHMYRMSILALCASDPNIDTAKCALMCLVHDLAEAQVGDIAPQDGVSRSEKRRLEEEAMHNFVYVMLHGSPAALRIEMLWKEYEAQESREARFVKDLDRFEMASQALEYERDRKAEDLSPFFNSSIPNIEHEEVKVWATDLMAERQRLQEN